MNLIQKLRLRARQNHVLSAKTALHRSLVMYVVESFINRSLDKSLSEMYDLAIDVCEAFLRPSFRSSNPPEFFKDMSLDQKIALDSLLKSQSVLEIRVLYFLSEIKFWDSILSEGDISERYKRELDIITKSGLNYENLTLAKIKKLSSAKLKKFRKNFRICQKNYTAELYESHVDKIDISAEKILATLSFFSALILICGIVYNHVFFSNLRISSHLVMSATDYIYMGLPNFLPTFATSLLVLAMWGWSSQSLIKELLIERDLGVSKKQGFEWAKAMVALGLLTVFIYTYLAQGIVLYFIIPLLFIYFYTHIFTYFYSFEDFKQPVLISYMTLFTLYLLVHTYFSASSESEHYLSSSYQPTYKISLKSNIYERYKSYLPLKITTSNVILYNPEDKEDIVIISRENLIAFTSNKTGNSGLNSSWSTSIKSVIKSNNKISAAENDANDNDVHEQTVEPTTKVVGSGSHQSNDQELNVQ
ncbi:hypothetical protein [Vibrio splendidus]|uniref:hypothetical protein n=1 Tax=Vibrio splendidus TaxID=29497 RepID=UPI001C076C8F|nr:hypothetical protein [Vibrio splendidus]MBU2911870.1 hypothetical protein [Vibrio splendidus]MDO6531559.1 hypothetical protein [Vibrio splendidus]MDO6551779.1 hypothetical protein [Vibrio splendidus]